MANTGKTSVFFDWSAEKNWSYEIILISIVPGIDDIIMKRVTLELFNLVFKLLRELIWNTFKVLNNFFIIRGKFIT